MTAWCKFKFTMLCKHVIVYYGWHVWLQSTMAAWGHKLKVSMSCIFFIYFILHAYLVCIMTIYITIVVLHFILLNKINLYDDRSYTSTANNDSLIFSMVLVSICWCFDSSSSDVFLSFSWLFKSSLVSFIIFFITDLTHNAFSTLASGCWVSSGVCNLSCSTFHFLYWYWVSSSCLLRFTRCPVPGFAVGCCCHTE